LESYVLEMRNKLSDDLAPYVTDRDREKINALLTENEDWLYGDGYDAQKSDYKKRLADLKQLGDPITNRKYEVDHRREYAEQLKAAIGGYQRFAASTEEKFAHITAEERQKLLEETNKVDEWLATAMSQADRQPKTENPSTTISQLKAKKEALDKFAAPIVNKPKPAPPKEEKKETPPTSKSPAPEQQQAAGGAGASPSPPPTSSASPSPEPKMDTAA